MKRIKKSLSHNPIILAGIVENHKEKYKGICLLKFDAKGSRIEQTVKISDGQFTELASTYSSIRTEKIQEEVTFYEFI